MVDIGPLHAKANVTHVSVELHTIKILLTRIVTYNAIVIFLAGYAMLVGAHWA